MIKLEKASRTGMRKVREPPIFFEWSNYFSLRIRGDASTLRAENKWLMKISEIWIFEIRFLKMLQKVFRGFLKKILFLQKNNGIFLK